MPVFCSLGEDEPNRGKVRLDTRMANREDIAAMRRQYGEVGLVDAQLPANPVELFNTWLADATANEIVVEANAMILSTVLDNQPSSRTVLLKDLTDEGFTFFSNYQSRKAKQISENQNVSLLFPWFPLERQVIILGVASKISSAESDKYFASRPRGSQIGAWASMQSTELSDRSVLEHEFAKLEAKWPVGTTIPRPDHWGGYVVLPTSIEFWQGRYSRLHDRIRYVRSENNDWQIKRFYP